VAVVAAAVDILDASLTAAAGNILLVDVENACLEQLRYLVWDIDPMF
jgi:SepF-like predicted cell division protein (DUF552 family)